MLAESAGARHSLGPSAMQQPQANLASLGLAANIGYPELALLSSLGGLMPGGAHHPQFSANDAQNKQADTEERQAASRGGRTRSGDSRSSSAYASRHQAAEQRRRTRINERLELLRKLVPHAERANTACFLEEVIKYVELLKSRNASLEKMVKDLQMQSTVAPVAITAASPQATAAAAGTSGLPVLSLSVPKTSDQQQAGAEVAAAAAAAPDSLADSSIPAPAAAALLQHAGSTTVPAGAAVSASPIVPSVANAAATMQAAAAAVPPAALPAAAAAAPVSTSQALEGLQGLLPPGIDVQQLLQQALVNAQAQLLQQHQQHQLAIQQASSSGGPAGSADNTANTTAAAIMSTAGNQPGQQQQQQQQHSQPLLAAPPSLNLQPLPAAPPAVAGAGTQPSILTALSEQRSQFVPISDSMFAAPAAKPPSPPIIPGSTLPADLQKLMVQLDPNAAAAASEAAGVANGFGSSATSTGGVAGTATAGAVPAAAGLVQPVTSYSTNTMPAAMPAAVTMGMIGLGGLGGFPGLRTGGNGNAFSNNAFLSAVAAAGAAENAAINALVEKQQQAAAAAAAAAAEEGDEEKSVPHKKRKMLVL